jgi:hypothetical protein
MWKPAPERSRPLTSPDSQVLGGLDKQRRVAPERAQPDLAPPLALSGVRRTRAPGQQSLPARTRASTASAGARRAAVCSSVASSSWHGDQDLRQVDLALAGFARSPALGAGTGRCRVSDTPARGSSSRSRSRVNTIWIAQAGRGTGWLTSPRRPGDGAARGSSSWFCRANGLLGGVDGGLISDAHSQYSRASCSCTWSLMMRSSTSRASSARALV